VCLPRSKEIEEEENEKSATTLMEEGIHKQGSSDFCECVYAGIKRRIIKISLKEILVLLAPLILTVTEHISLMFDFFLLLSCLEQETPANFPGPQF
jgi:hypothetical protein